MTWLNYLQDYFIFYLEPIDKEYTMLSKDQKAVTEAHTPGPPTIYN